MMNKNLVKIIAIVISASMVITTVALAIVLSV